MSDTNAVWVGGKSGNTTLEMDPSVYDAALFYRTAKIALNYLTFGIAGGLARVYGFTDVDGKQPH